MPDAHRGFPSEFAVSTLLRYHDPFARTLKKLLDG
jgi:hypothetical protein